MILGDGANRVAVDFGPQFSTRASHEGPPGAFLNLSVPFFA